MRYSGLLIVLSLLIWGCDKTYDSVIDTTSNNYQVSSVSHQESYDLKNPGDSVLSVRVVFSPGSQFSSAGFDVVSSDNNVLNSSRIELLFLGANIYQNSFLLQREFPNGTYNVRIYVTGLDGKTNLAATSSFLFNNGQDNLPPEISNTLIDPDTVVVTDTTIIFTSVEVVDSNGANDIDEVYFKVYRPDGSSNNNKFYLYDDGSCCPIPPLNVESGDLVAGDGIFSLTIQVDQSNPKGTYRFEFQAKDRSDSLSNIINHFVLIQ